MADTQKVATDITANTANFEAGMQRVQSAAKQAADSLTGSFKSIGGTVDGLTGKLTALIGVLAGGGALKKFITDSNEWAGSAGKMASQLGITTQQASVLNTALTRLGIDSDVYTSAAQKLSKQVFSNGDAFAVMGIKVRDATGAYRPVTELMGEVNTKLAEIKNPIEQNIAGQQLYGKGWAEIRTILRLTDEQMKASEQRARELGLIVGPQGAALAKQYTAQLRDLNLVGKSIEIQFGQALTPVFVQVGAAMSGQVSTAARALAVSMETVAVLGANVQFVFGGLGREIAAVAAQLSLIGEVITAPVSKVAEVARGFTTRWTAISDAVKADGVRARAELDAFERKVLGLDTKKPFAQPLPPPPNINQGPQYKFKPEKEEGTTAEKSRMAEWEARLEAQKLAHEREQAEAGTFYEFSKAREAAYWKGILDTVRTTDAERFSLQKKYSGLELDQRRQSFEGEQAELRTRIDAAKGNFQQQEVLAAIYTERAGQRFGTESKQYQEALKQQQDLYRAHREALLEIGKIASQRSRDQQLEDVATIERGAQLERELGLITQAQLLKVRADTIEQRRQIEENAKQAELLAMQGNPNADPVALARLEAELDGIRRKYRQEAMANKGDQAVDKARPLEAFLGTSQAAVQQGLDSMVQRMRFTLGGVQQVARQVGASLVQEMVTKPAAEFITAQARQLAMALLFGEQRVGIESATALEIGGIQAGLSLRNIAASAAEAAASTYKSIAAIPIVGPYLAPAAAATALAAVVGFGRKIFSAEGGFDIPPGMNPMVQTHAEEMILPRAPANALRMISEHLANGGGLGGGQGGSSGPAPVMRVVPMPGNFWMAHRDDILAATDKAARARMR